MRWIAPIVLAVALAGCGHQVKMRDLQASCEQRYARFSDMAQCLRGETGQYMAQHPGDPNADLTGVYLAWLDAAGERVDAGTMAESEARLGAAELYSRLQSTALDRQHAANADWQLRYQGFLQGLATWNALANQPRPSSRIITCQGVGPAMVTCF
jgi:hypothetical protein